MHSLRIAGLLALVLMAGACATYSDHTRAARESIARGNLAQGEKELNELLGVETSRDLPSKFGSETALALLERATILQAMRDYSTSARDFSAAEKELELLDIANDDVGSIGKYLYSDDATRYKAPPTEKLLLNAFNMVNYLARGDLQGARVEARRYSVMRKYLEDYFPGTAHGAFGAYLAGFVYEKSGSPDEALRYYDEVLASVDAPSLAGPISRLSRMTPYTSERLARYAGGEEPAPGDAAAEVPGRSDGGEILVILKTGRVSVKEPERIPIGAALGLASNYVSGDTKVLEYGMFKVVSYPELRPTKDLYSGGTCSVAGAGVQFDWLTDIDAEIKAEYETIKPKIIGSALTRMITRAVAAEGARALGRKQNNAIGFLAAAITEGTMVALDKPDTRSWSTLPANVHIARLQVPGGTHEISVQLNGAGAGTTLRQSVTVEPGGFAVVDFTTLR